MTLSKCTCGGKADLVLKDVGNGPLYYVICSGCGVVMSGQPSPQIAAMIWDKRVRPDRWRER